MEQSKIIDTLETYQCVNWINRDFYLCSPVNLTNTLVLQPSLLSILQNQLGVALDALTWSFVIQDEHGDVVGSRVDRMDHVQDTLQAEAEACISTPNGEVGSLRRSIFVPPETVNFRPQSHLPQTSHSPLPPSRPTKKRYATTRPVVKHYGSSIENYPKKIY